jgi:hypothetical protein
MARKPTVKQVRKSLMVEEEKLERARELLDADSDADVFRQALDFLLEHYEAPKPAAAPPPLSAAMKEEE